MSLADLIQTEKETSLSTKLTLFFFSLDAVFLAEWLVMITTYNVVSDVLLILNVCVSEEKKFLVNVCVCVQSKEKPMKRQQQQNMRYEKKYMMNVRIIIDKQHIFPFTSTIHFIKRALSWMYGECKSETGNNNDLFLFILHSTSSEVNLVLNPSRATYCTEREKNQKTYIRK